MSLPESQVTSHLKDVLRESQNFTFALAKKWLGALLVLQSFIYLSGLVAIFASDATLNYPAVAFFIAVVNTWISYRISQLRGAGDECKRKHELWDGLGVPPTCKWLANYRLANAGALETAEENLLRKGITYDSTETQGPRRMLENVVESAWFSNHLARWCAIGLTWGILGTTLLFVVALFFLTSSTAEFESRDAAARAIAATFVFVISLGMIRGMLAYYSFSRKADRCEEEASKLLTTENNPTEFEAFRILSDYQLARAAAPMIPTWVWKLFRGRLNENWKIKKGGK